MINLQDAFTDSPSFRSSVAESERYLHFLEDLVRDVARAATAVLHAQEALRIAEDSFAECLKKLGTVYDDQQASFADSLEDFARSISGLARGRESFNMQIEEAFLQPLADYETTVVEGTTKKLAKEHLAAREGYEKALERFLTKPPATTEEAVSEAADEVAEANYQRHKQALRYSRHLNERVGKQKFDIIDNLLVFMFSWSSFHHAAHEMLSESKSAMDQVSRKLQLAKQQASMRQNDEQVESKYLSAALSRYNPEMSQFVASSSSAATQKAGYLFKRPVQTLRNAWSAWERMWFVCDVTASTLYYQKPGDEEERNFIDLKTAMVRPARDVDRRHCLEIVCPNTTYVLQSENKDDMKAWIDCLQRANARALFLHRPPEQRTGASAVLDRVLSVAGNERCADCGEIEPTWAAISFGVTLCIECSGVHRNLGRVGQVSKIRSMTLDHWTPETVGVMVSLGNTKVNGIFEALLGPRSKDGVDLVRPSRSADRDVLEKYITNKYVAKQFVKDMDAEETVEDLTQHLWIAADLGDLAQCLQLLAWGAAINMRNGDEQGSTILHHVIRNNATDVVVEFLLLQGVDVDAQDDLGFTALHHAIALSKLPVAIVLLRRGASLKLKDVHGTSVLDIAEQKQDPSCLTLVRAVSQGLMTVDQAAEMLIDFRDLDNEEEKHAKTARADSSSLTIAVAGQASGDGAQATLQEA